MSFLAAVLIIVLSAGLPAVACTDSPWLALAVAPLLFALAATVAGMLATFIGVSVPPLLIVLVVGADVAAVRSLRGRHWGPWLRRQPLAGAVVTLAGVVGLLGLKSPALNWDTRTHWFGPARWFFGGGSYVAYAIGNPVFGHRDYPPLIAATAGSLWSFQGHVDLRSGQVLIALVNFGAVVVMGLAIPRLFPRLGVMPAVAGAALVLAAYGYAGKWSVDGYADLVWAACVTIAVVRLLIAPYRRTDVVIGSLALAVAGLAKNEGTVVALAIGLATCWRHRSILREIPELLAALAVTLVWPVYVRIRGVPATFRGQDLRAFLTGNSQIWGRAVPTGRALNQQIGGLLIVAAGCTVLGLLTARSARREAHIGSTWWTWAVAGITWCALWATYVISISNLSSWLKSSVTRVTISLRLLLLSETIIWTMCGLKTIGHHRQRDPLTAHPNNRAPSDSHVLRSAADGTRAANG